MARRLIRWIWVPAGVRWAPIGQTGGGAIRLIVPGELRLEGEITADGIGGYGGSGGSIYATVGRLSGSGLFTADGV